MPLGWTIIVLAQWIAIVFLAVVVLGLLRRISPVLERAADFPPMFASRQQAFSIGDRLPSFQIRDSGGYSIGADSFTSHPTVLLFMDNDCGPCIRLAESLNDFEVNNIPADVAIIAGHESPNLPRLDGKVKIFSDESDGLSSKLGISAKPFAIAVDASGIIRDSRVPNSIDDIVDLAGLARQGDRGTNDLLR